MSAERDFHRIAGVLAPDRYVRRMTPRTHRTGALVCALGLALLSACRSGDDDASSTSTGPTSTSDAANATTAPSASPSTTAGAATTPVRNIVAAANAFLGTLSATEKGTVQFDSSNTAQKQKWSNLPNGAFQRAGLMWGNMSEASQNAWFALMKASMSTEGYDRVIAEWNADEALATTGGSMFGKKYYCSSQWRCTAPPSGSP